MGSRRVRAWLILPGLRRLSLRLCAAGLPALGLACAPAVLDLVGGATAAEPPAAVRGAAGEQAEVIIVEKQDAAPQAGKVEAPAADTLPPVGPILPPKPPAKVVPITLDTVFRVAEQQNPKVRLAREKVNGACADEQVAQYAWLPHLYAGPSYWRHEGGIQNPDGTFVHSSNGAGWGGTEIVGQFDVHEIAYQRVQACREVWQNKTELSQVTSQQLLDATQTYIDLLAARSGELVSRRLHDRLEELLNKVKKRKELATPSQREFIEAEIEDERQRVEKMKEAARNAAAKLVYLLGLDPCTELEPADPALLPLDLIDVHAPTCDLVAKALVNGPGVHELEGMLAMLHHSMEQAQGPSKFLPVLEMRMGEGIFGAGPGAENTWDNRFDLGLQARWDLSNLVTGKQRLRSAESKLHQVHLDYDDLRGRLAEGVQEAQDTALSSQAQIPLGQRQIEHARKADEVLQKQLDAFEPANAMLLFTDALRAVQALRAAEFNVLGAISSFDKAQLRLILLLGPTDHHPAPGPGPCP
jgi:outer membrane protein TolC